MDFGRHMFKLNYFLIDIVNYYSYNNRSDIINC
jgi:hypothetical protein